MRSELVQRGRSRRSFDDAGASTVEFALVAPLLLMLIFGIMEFGWLFAQHLDVRHGTREASRLVAVNWSASDPESVADVQTAEIVAESCSRMQHGEGALVSMGLVSSGIGAADKGSVARVEVARKPEQLTGMFGPIIDPIELSSSVELRLEREATWQQGSGVCS